MTLLSSPRLKLSPRSIGWTWFVASVVIVPIALFVVLEPDWYYLQNGLDPFFYTGYVQNFQNLFHAVGDDHYFISRWTIYMPQRVLLQLFDSPKAAFLGFRWFGAGVVTGSVMALGRERWRRPDAIALAVLVLMMPISIRALLTDYSDAVVFPLGTAMIVLVTLHPDRRRVAAVAGALFGGIVVANPFGATLAAATLPFWLRRVPRTRWAWLVSSAAAGAAVVLIGGLLFFRWRYGVPNIYSPTVDYIRDQGTSSDPLKSPRLWWLGYRLWIYLPPMLIAIYHVLHRRYQFDFGAAERAIVGICTVQYLVQVWFQFSRHGSTLEISYYWSYIAPAFALTFCVVIAALVQRCPRWFLPGLTVVSVVAVRVVGSPAPEVFQSWIDALLVIGAIAFLARRVVTSRPAVVATILIGTVVLLQTSSPRPEPILAGELRVQSAYDVVYDNEHSPGVQTFESVTWFTDQVSALPDAVVRSAWFWFDTELGARMSAMFGAQVSGRWLNPNWPSAVATDPFPPDVVAGIQAGSYPTIVVIGPAADVRATADQILSARPSMRVVLDVAAPDQPDTIVQVLSLLA